jgi:hypothetical protein
MPFDWASHERNQLIAFPLELVEVFNQNLIKIYGIVA